MIDDFPQAWPLVINPIAFVTISVSKDEYTETIFHVIRPFTFVLLPSAKILVHSSPMSEVIFIEAFVDIAIFHMHLAWTLFFSIFQISFKELPTAKSIDSFAIEII